MSQQRSSTLHAFLEQQTKAQLITLLEELAERHTVVREALQDRCELATGDVARLVQTVRQDIAELSAEPAWSNHWDDVGSGPTSGQRSGLRPCTTWKPGSYRRPPDARG